MSTGQLFSSKGRIYFRNLQSESESTRVCIIWENRLRTGSITIFRHKGNLRICTHVNHNRDQCKKIKQRNTKIE